MPGIIRLALFLFFTLTFFRPAILSGQGAPSDTNTFEKAARWLKEYAVPIPHPRQEEAYKNLDFLTPLFNGKRLVALGEFTHGARELNQAKLPLVKYLHEELNFNVLLFESGIGELGVMNPWRADSSARRLLHAGLTGPWRTKEYLELLEYAQSRDSLVLGGFDPQKSGQAFKGYLEEHLYPLDTALAQTAYQLEEDNNEIVGRMKREEIDSSILEGCRQLVQRYRELSRQLEKLEVRTEWMARTIQNRIAFLEYYSAYKRQYRPRWAARDSLMAANILWYANELFPDEKLIVIAHNFHISRFNEEEQVMGEWLAQAMGDEMYTVGMFGGKGEYANNSRKPETLSVPSEPNNLRKLLGSAEREALFLNFPKEQIPRYGSEWLFEEVIVDHSFLDLVGGKTLTLSRCFDGLIYIHSISPPEFD